MTSQTRWPELSITGKNGSVILSEAFNNALASLSNAHGEEVAHLQNQIAWLQGSRGQRYEVNTLDSREAGASTHPVVVGFAQAHVDPIAFVEGPGLRSFPATATMRATDGFISNRNACHHLHNEVFVENPSLALIALEERRASINNADIPDPQRTSTNSAALRASIDMKDPRSSQSSVRLKPVDVVPSLNRLSMNQLSINPVTTNMNQITTNPLTTTMNAMDQRSLAKPNTSRVTSSANSTGTDDQNRKSIEDRHGLLKDAWKKVMENSSNNELKDHLTLAKERAKDMNRLSQKMHSSANRQALMMRSSHAGWRTPSITEESSAFDRMVESPGFDFLCGIVIIFNSVLIGHNVNAYATTGSTNEENKYLGHDCSIFFFLEMVLRIINQKTKYLTSEQRNWNLFDTLLVLMSVVDFLMTDILHAGTEHQHFASVKTIKMLRIIRVFRIFRFFHELGILALMITDSMSHLMWALFTLIIIIYVFAVLFTQIAADFLLRPSSNDYEDQAGLPGEIHRWFGTLPQTIYTLFQAMLNGVSWGLLTDSLLVMGLIPVGLFIFYIAFAILAVLNIITGVFVENAVETARGQREFLVKKEMELREAYVGEMRQLFTTIDLDGSGTVSLDEFLRYLMDPCMVYYLQALGLDPHDVERLFRLLDDDQSGEVSVDEFLDGCLRLKGAARSIDVHHLLHEITKIKKRIAENFDLLLGVLGVKKLHSDVGFSNSMESANEGVSSHMLGLAKVSEKSAEGEL